MVDGATKIWSRPIGPQPKNNVGDIRNHPEYGIQIWDGSSWFSVGKEPIKEQ